MRKAQFPLKHFDGFLMGQGVTEQTRGQYISYVRRALKRSLIEELINEVALKDYRDSLAPRSQIALKTAWEHFRTYLRHNGLDAPTLYVSKKPKLEDLPVAAAIAAFMKVKIPLNGLVWGCVSRREDGSITIDNYWDLDKGLEEQLKILHDWSQPTDEESPLVAKSPGHHEEMPQWTLRRLGRAHKRSSSSVSSAPTITGLAATPLAEGASTFRPPHD